MRRVAAGAAAVALLAAVAMVAVLSVQRWQDRTPPGFEDAPVQAAEEAASGFFTLSYATIDDDVARVLDLATGEFEAQYQEKVAGLRQSVLDQQLVLTAVVPESGGALEYLTADEAWVLVSVDVHTEGADGVDQDSRYRTRVVLERSAGDRWLVSRLEQVG